MTPAPGHCPWRERRLAWPAGLYSRVRPVYGVMYALT